LNVCSDELGEFAVAKVLLLFECFACFEFVRLRSIEVDLIVIALALLAELLNFRSLNAR